MRTVEQYVKILRNYKKSNAIRLGISRIGIFGSVARNEQTEKSDVDVCVQLVRPDIFVLVHIKEELEELFQKPVDVVRLRPNMDRMLLSQIQKDCVYAD